MTINPRVEEYAQIQCPSFISDKQRTCQLLVKKQMDKFDNKKLNTMLMANLAHFMYSHIMHNFVELCYEINFSKRYLQNMTQLNLKFN